MSALFVKACPICGHENLAIASFCDDCDADLMNVAVSMRAEELAEAPKAAPPENSPPTPIVAPGFIPLIESQNEIKTARAEARTNAKDAIELELVADPTRRFRVLEGQSVGRSSQADVVLCDVPDLEFISRAHARLFKRRSQWYAQYIAQGNAITVDGTSSSDETELALYPDSILVLSFTAFRVKIEGVTP